MLLGAASAVVVRWAGGGDGFGAPLHLRLLGEANMKKKKIIKNTLNIHLVVSLLLSHRRRRWLVRFEVDPTSGDRPTRVDSI